MAASSASAWASAGAGGLTRRLILLATALLATASLFSSPPSWQFQELAAFPSDRLSIRIGRGEALNSGLPDASFVTVFLTWSRPPAGQTLLVESSLDGKTWRFRVFVKSTDRGVSFSLRRLEKAEFFRLRAVPAASFSTLFP